jgi:hypothetical protein
MPEHALRDRPHYQSLETTTSMSPDHHKIRLLSFHSSPNLNVDVAQPDLCRDANAGFAGFRLEFLKKPFGFLFQVRSQILCTERRPISGWNNGRHDVQHMNSRFVICGELDGVLKRLLRGLEKVDRA